MHTEPAPTLDEVWRLIKELALQSKETDRKFQETDRKFQETGQMIKELVQQSKKTEQIIGNLGNRLGDFVEAFVEPGAVGIFQARGIPVTEVSRQVTKKNPELGLAMEIDLLVQNGDSCILIEVKSRLTEDHVNDHLKRMEKFKLLFPRYADRKTYGAMAALVIPENVEKYANRKGLFVIGQNGETAEIRNDEAFQPRVW